MQLAPAQSFSLRALAELFNLGFSGYPHPPAFDEERFRRHVVYYDIDLSASRVVVVDRPVAFALLARRGADAWIGGVGTAPEHRRRGLGRVAMTAVLEAAAGAGAEVVWLEVLEENEAASDLYRELGFEMVRRLAVWGIPVASSSVSGARSLEVGAARAWIDGHDAERESWQRTGATLDRMRERGAPLQAVGVVRGGSIAGAAVYEAAEERVAVLQAYGGDESSAIDVLRAAALGEKPVRAANYPSGGMTERAFRGVGATLLATQHEMRLSLTGG